MLRNLLLLAAAASPALGQTNAKSWTGWDCCKPVCAGAANNQTLLNNRGVVKTCDKNNRPLDQQAGVRAINGCLGGNGYMCDEFQPVPVSADLSYGFVYMISDAQTENHPNCCKCVEITWQSGPAAGKQMIAQVVTPGGSGGDIKRNDLIVLIPGGGLGPLSAGCPAQYGRDIRWGDGNGGMRNRGQCESLPPNLQAGCYWRFNWAGGDMFGWDISYRPTSCPARLTRISGCQA